MLLSFVCIFDPEEMLGQSKVRKRWKVLKIDKYTNTLMRRKLSHESMKHTREGERKEGKKKMAGWGVGYI